MRRVLSIALSACLLASAARGGILAPIVSGGNGATTSTIQLVAHTIGQTGDTFNVTTPAINTTGADFIVVVLEATTFTLPAPITDSKGNTGWTNLSGHSTGGQTNVILYKENPTVGSGHTFTITSGGSPHFPAIAVAAFSGVKSSSSFDQQNGNTTASGTSVSPGVITPTENKELTIFGVGDAHTTTLSINRGVILDQAALVGGTAFGVGLAYEIQGAASATNPTWSWTGAAREETSSASFKAQ